MQAICEGCECRSGWVRDHDKSGEISTESAAEMIEIYPNILPKILVVPPVLLMMRLGGLEFYWLAAAASERVMGKLSHLSGSHYLQWSLTALRLCVYKSGRKKGKQTLILFCSGTGGELSPRSLSSTAAATCWASIYRSWAPSVPAPAPCCWLWSVPPQSCTPPPFSDSWEGPRQTAGLTCSPSELHGVETLAALISYIVMSLLPLPDPGKAWGEKSSWPLKWEYQCED